MHVTIIGGANKTKDLAVYSEEVWVLGTHMDNHPEEKVTRIFEIHTDLSSMPEGYRQWLVDKKIPLYVTEGFPIEADHIVIYPIEKALNLVGGHITSSIAYMMALAILEGATKISIYGVDMDIDDGEYFRQRPGLYALRGYAIARGIEVEAPLSPLFIEALYPQLSMGIDPYTQKQFKHMAALHQQKINEAKQNINELNRIIDTHYGCVQVYERLSKIARTTDAGIKVQFIEDSAKLGDIHE